MANLDNWLKLAQPPKEALKQIAGGRLKGMTDINPQWRYKAMTELFGQCGEGWRYEIIKLWTEPGMDGQMFAFAHVHLHIKTGEHWSDLIPGIGGSMLLEKDKYGLHHNDEAYKMAITDALSVAMKMLGMGADIYMGRWDGSKYREQAPNPSSGAGTKKEAYDSLSLEDRAWIDNLATEVEEVFAVDGAEPAITHIKAAMGENADITFKLALWWKLDSKTRSAIDAIQKGIKKNA